MKHRKLYFDVIRILSCMMIVLMHSPMPGLGTSGVVLSGISYITAAGIGLFFMISGALVLARHSKGENEYENEKHSTLSDNLHVFKFLRKRIVKVGVPLASWTALGYGLDGIGYETAKVGVLWFLWTILGLYVLSPILIRWLTLATSKEVIFYLCIWALSLCYPWIRIFVPIEIVDTSWLYYFHGYVGYFVLGWYLMQKESWSSKVGTGLISAVALLSVALPICVLISGVKVNFYDVFWYLSPSVVLMCVAWFVALKRCEERLQVMSQKAKKTLVWLSDMTFGIYLVHILIMRGWLWRTEWMQNMNGLAQIAVCFVLTFVISLLITVGLKKIPYVRMVVGGVRKNC